MISICSIIKKRRSVRNFSAEQIKDEELNTILETATYAPSGHNCQPWHFTAIQNKELLELINQKTKVQMTASQQDWAVKMGQSEHYHIFHRAPTVIIVSGNKNEDSPLPLAATGISYTPLVDCAAAIQNILLSAESLGIGSCWIGIVNFFFSLPEVKKLSIPEDYQPYFAVALGYKANADLELTAPKRKDHVIHYLR